MRRARLSGSSARPRGTLLSFILEVELRKTVEGLEVEVSFREMLRDLSWVRVVELRVKDPLFWVRTELAGQAYQAFKAAGVRLP